MVKTRRGVDRPVPYRGYTDDFEEKLVISVATTGGLHGKEVNPNLPTQPEEVAKMLGI
jgi:3-keto-5-aminohexanoate cleavage enzyme